MKILLIYPYCIEDRLYGEETSILPIGLYYIGAILKKNNYDVEILNWHDINKAPHLIKEGLLEKAPDIIGLSILQANRWGGIEIARTAKQINPRIKIIFGGIGATFLWKHLLENFKEIDFLVIGEGEYPFLGLVEYLKNPANNKLSEIKGIAYNKNGKAIKTEPAAYIEDLDELPVPARYFTYQHLSSTRGCPGNCSFCGSPKFWGRKVRFHSSDYFVEQLELLSRKGVSFFYFSDDTFTINKKRVIEICQKIIEKDLNITWAAISRVDYVNEEILSWMRRAGCIQISYGVESGSEKIRYQILNKKIEDEQIKKAFRMTTKYGILSRAYFIYGLKGETWSTIQETIDLIDEIKPLSAIFYILDLFPGTALYDDYQKKTGITDDIWKKKIEDIMYFETDPLLSQDMIIAFGHKLRSYYYSNINLYADSVELINEKSFYPMHSDFFSRLGMTFSHGDYADKEEIQNKEKIAEKLFKRSLEYYPDQRAFLGLGIIRQMRKDFKESIRILLKAIRYFPENEQLILCLGISYMNLGAFEEALSHFLEFETSPQIIPYIANCYHALGNYAKEAEINKKNNLLS